ncbi:MAG TPA: DUF6311 domain-containing protein [Rhodanobacteraceae bacterium]|nr:DUF6311 domain-containing protein [Rhodanobacteraceae bacterium]
MSASSVVAGALGQGLRVPRFWIALAFGVVFAALTLDAGYVTGRGAYWNAQLGDPAKGEIGWFYYARDGWRFPVFDIGTYHDPEGGSIVLSDSLPLFALPAKAIYKLVDSPDERPPIYTGIWVALCLVLQAVFASRLLRALGIRDFVAHVAGVALLCYLPIVMLRFGQAALMAQFVLLFALEGYVRAKRVGLTRRDWILQCALAPFVLLVHPYLAAMCGCIVAATILDQWRERRIGFGGVAAAFGSIATLALALMFVGGFFSAARGDFGDYGLYSLNLLSPWVPFPQTRAGMLLGITELPVIPGTNQWEGGAYLGLGVMLLGLLALPALADWRRNLMRHAVLFAMLIAVLAFAISQRIGIGAREVATLPIPDFLLHALSQFRGSGRFVWIAVYALAAALIAAIAARYGDRARWILVAAALLEIVDVWPMQAGVRAASASSAPGTIDRAAWTRLIAAHRRIFVFPSFECGGIFGRDVPGTKFREIEIDWIAAERNVPINSAYLARFTKDCAREHEDAIANFDQPGLLRIYRSTDQIGTYLQQHGLDFGRCGYLDDAVVCSGDEDLSGLR